MFSLWLFMGAIPWWLVWIPCSNDRARKKETPWEVNGICTTGDGKNTDTYDDESF